jgi:hypothetical protein
MEVNCTEPSRSYTSLLWFDIVQTKNRGRAEKTLKYFNCNNNIGSSSNNNFNNLRVITLGPVP